MNNRSFTSTVTATVEAPRKTHHHPHDQHLLHRHAAPLPIPLATLTLLIAALLLTACAQPDRDDETAGLPDPDDVTAVFGPSTSDNTPTEDRPTLVTIHRLDMLLDGNTDDAWALVNEDAFPPITRTVWHANGIRIGVIDSYHLARFADTIPGVVAVQRSTLAPAEHPAVLIAAPRQAEPITIDLTIPPRAVREQVVRSGRLQLLAGITDLNPDDPDNPRLRVELTPHQFVPRISLTPPDPLTKHLDGNQFTELTLRTDLNPRRMLVVGLYRPPPPEPQAPDDEPDTPDTTPQPDPDTRINAQAAPETGPSTTDTPGTPDTTDAESPDDQTQPDTKPQPQPLPPHLGRALLTGQRLSRDVQTFLLISIEPKTQTTAPAPEPNPN